MWLALISTLASGLVMGSETTAASWPSPAPVVTHERVFAIPFRVDPVDDPARQVVEVELHVSTDRGGTWQLYARAQTTERHFIFRAAGDGEYWFAIRTVDRAGRTLPESITVPGLRVVVDTRKNDPAVVSSGRPETHNAEKPVTNEQVSAIDENTGSVSITINPAVGRNLASANTDNASGPALVGLPPGEQPRLVNSRLFELDYEVDSVGPSGIGKVELWGTRDGGQTWRSFGVDNDKVSPFTVHVEEEGVYGFRVVVTNGAGLGGKPPVGGDLPDLWISVDLTRPSARIVSAQQGVDQESGHLIIVWRADDRQLAARPVSLLFSESRSGPWLPIASGLENTGRYAWPIDSRTPVRLYLRLEVRDEAGNVGVHELAEPVSIDQSRPTIRVRQVRPVG